MPYVYIGKTHNLVGKTMWEIVCNLPNFGVGRMVVRQKLLRYSEPCFMRIVQAEPWMDDENTKGKLLVEEVFRGNHHGVVEKSNVAYKPDHLLIPKHEEHKYIEAFNNHQTKDIRIFAPTAEMPPLLKLIAEKKNHHAKDLKMSLKDSNPRARIAEEGETPNAFATCSLGTPVCKHLYEGVLE